VKLDLNTPEFTDLLRTAPLADKIATVTAVLVTEKQVMSTVVNGDFVETVNTAHPGDFIVTNPSGEQYILTAENFHSRYEATDELGVYQARGSIRVIKNPTGEPVEIIAPWGEPQFGDSDCYFAVTVAGPEDEVTSDRYIIENQAFLYTYKFR
jgi:hypothetical protein